MTDATLNVQGSCNELCDTNPDPGVYNARNAANIAWMQDTFAAAPGLCPFHGRVSLKTARAAARPHELLRLTGSVSRTTGRAGLRRATSSKPARSYMELAPNHMASSLDRPGLLTG